MFYRINKYSKIWLQSEQPTAGNAKEQQQSSLPELKATPERKAQKIKYLCKLMITKTKVTIFLSLIKRLYNIEVF